MKFMRKLVIILLVFLTVVGNVQPVRAEEFINELTSTETVDPVTEPATEEVVVEPAQELVEATVTEATTEEIVVETPTKVGEESVQPEQPETEKSSEIKVYESNVLQTELVDTNQLSTKLVDEEEIIYETIKFETNTCPFPNSKFTVTNQSSEKTLFYTVPTALEERFAWKIEYESVGLESKQIENPYITLSLPKEYINQDSRGRYDISTDVGFPIESTEVYQEGDNAVIRIELDTNIVSSTSLAFNVYATPKPRVTPEGYKFTPTVNLHSNTGDSAGLLCKAVLAEKTTYQVKYDTPQLTKSISPTLNMGDSSIHYGGDLDATNSNFLTTNVNNLEFIQFNFIMSAVKPKDGYSYAPGINKMRATQSLILTETLPTYVGLNGLTYTAYFDQQANPDWIDNKNGTVTLKVDRGSETSSENALKNTPLLLKFPGAPISPDSNRKTHDLTNSASVTPVFVNESELEKGKKWTASDDITFRLDGDLFNGKGIFLKNSNTMRTFNVDPLLPEVSQDVYTVTVANTLTFDLKDLVITEGNFDERMYVYRIYAQSRLTNNMVARVTGVLSDGSEEDIPFEKNNNHFSVYADTQTTEAVKNKLESNSTTSVVSRYKSVKIYLDESVVMKPGDSFTLFVNMRLTNPDTILEGLQNETLKDLKLINNANLTGVGVYNNTEREFSLDSGSYGNLKTKIERFTFNKTTRGNTRYNLGENFSFTFRLDLNNLSPARPVGGIEIFDLLPIGTTYKNVGIEGDRTLLREPEVIEDYKGTGRTAVIIRLREGVLAGDFGSKLINLNVSINENATRSFDPEYAVLNRNTAYVTSSDPKFNPVNYYNPDSLINPLPNTGIDEYIELSADEKIVGSSSTFRFSEPESYYSLKQIRRVRNSVNNIGNPIYDANVPTSAFTTGTINTNFNEYFEYRLRTVNNRPLPRTALTLVDIIEPYENTNFRNVLANELVVPEEFEVLYTTDEPGKDSSLWLGLNWQTWNQLSDSERKNIKAFRIDLKPGKSIGPGKTVDFIIPMITPSLSKETKELGSLKSNNNLYQFTEPQLDSNTMSPDILLNSTSSAEYVNSVSNVLPPILEVTKTFITSNQYDNLSVSVHIIDSSSSEVVFGDVVLNNDNEFKNWLPLNDIMLSKIDPMNFVIKEVDEQDGEIDIDGRKFEVSYEDIEYTDNIYKIGVSNREFLEVQANKKWIMISDEDHPSSLNIQLLRNGDVINTHQLVDPNWSYTFEEDQNNKRLYDSDLNKNPYTYTVSEELLNGFNLETEIKKDELGNIIVNLTNTEKVISVNVTKEWDMVDGESQPVAPVTITLLRNGVEYLEPKELVDNTVSWTDLPKYDENGTEYEYSVKESYVPGYDLISNTPSSNTETGDVTVKLANKQQAISVEVTKTWDAVNLDQPDSITVNLLRNKEQYKSTELTQENGWANSFENLPKVDPSGNNYEYTIEEVVPVGYEATVEEYLITNTRTLTTVPFNKLWDVVEGEELPTEIEINLYRDGQKINSMVVTENDDWKGEFDEDSTGMKLPLTNPLTEKDYVYTVDETPIIGFEASVENNTITNKQVTVSVEVSKAWDMVEGESQPVNPVTITLLRNGVEYKDPKQLVDNSVTWTDLPKYDENGEVYEYTVSESKVHGYELVLNEVTVNPETGDVTVTLENKQEVTFLKVSKIWNLVNATESDIKVSLTRNGDEYASVVLSNDNNFTHTFENLPMFDQEGNSYEYMVSELGEEEGIITIDGVDFEVDIERDQEGFVITNTEVVVPKDEEQSPVKKPELPKTGADYSFISMSGLITILGGAYLLLSKKKEQ